MVFVVHYLQSKQALQILSHHGPPESCLGCIEIIHTKAINAIVVAQLPDPVLTIRPLVVQMPDHISRKVHALVHPSSYDIVTLVFLKFAQGLIPIEPAISGLCYKAASSRVLFKTILWTLKLALLGWRDFL